MIWWPKLAGSIVAVMASVALVAAGLVISRTGATAEQYLRDLVFIGGFATFGLVGGALVIKRPSHPVAWCLSAIGLVGSTGLLAGEYAAIATYAGSLWPLIAAWWGAAWFFPGFALVLVFLPLLFPSGKLPSGKWRAVEAVAGLSAGLAFVVSTLADRFETDRYSIENPWAIEGLTIDTGRASGPMAGFLITIQTLLYVSVVLAFASIAVRFRRSEAVERQQLKWFFLAASVLISMFLVTSVFFPNLPYGEAIFGVAVSLIPLSVAIAILRYRLYEIDRIISRTVTYGLVAGMLAAVYAGGVFLVQGVIGAEGDLAVAASTLAAFALFAPLRRRVQRGVDRRFNRSRYDAARVVEGLASKLRDRVELEVVTAELVGAARSALQPATVGVWVREP